MPLVSMVVPVFNIERYLARCVNSIRKQSCTDLEIILVNDGSVDGSGEICDDLALRDPRIKVLHQNNSGAAGARNAGIELARGKFISFVDGDDEIKEGMVEHLVSLLLDRPEAEISACSLTTLSSHSELDDLADPTETSFLTGEQALVQLLNQKIVNGPVAKVFRIELFKEVRFPVGVKVGEDLLTNIQLFERSRGLILSPLPLYVYKIREGSAMTTLKLEDRMYLIDKLEEASRDPKLKLFKRDFSSRIFSEALYASSIPRDKDNLSAQWISHPVDSVFSRHKKEVFLNPSDSLKRRMLAGLAFIAPFFPRFVINMAKYVNQLRNKPLSTSN